MAVPAAVSAVGLAALIAVPGQPAGVDEGPVSGAGSLHVTVQERAQERLRVGDRVEYTIRVRNAGYEALPEARVVQFLPPSMRYVSGAPEGAEAGRAEWAQPLEAGERAVLTVVGAVTEMPEMGRRPVSTVCLRSGPEAELASCTSSVHEVHRGLPLALVAAVLFLVLSLSAGAGGLLRYRGVRAARSERVPLASHDPGSESNIRPLSDQGSVCQLDLQR